MTIPENWRAEAFNPATNSSNRIHADDVAKEYGFKGGLVPGVTVSGYLFHPAVLAWGEDWLTRGHGKVVVHKPLYDGHDFEVQVSNQTDTAYRAELIDMEGTRCATAEVYLADELPQPPTRRGDDLLPKEADIAPATLHEMQRLQASGMRALKIRWSEKHEMSAYLRDSSLLPDLHRFDADGFAHGAFLLGITNWVLAGNAYMNPWVHLQTESQFFAMVPYGTYLIAECEIKDLFSKRGHEFVDVKVDIYEEETSKPVMTADLRAIYKMRGLK